MKRCPQCGREYDNSMMFCLDDGAELLYGPASGDEPATAILSDWVVSASGEAKTAVFRAANPNSIAVLPFVNISPDPENEYFCDGLAEELLNALSKIDKLKVAARTSAFSFKGKNKSVREIGEKLGVGKVLEGSVRRFGTKIRISIQLVNAADGFRLWSESYDREMQDIFQLQDEITLAVIDALKVELLGPTRELVLKRYTDNAEAYELYLKGRYHHYKYTAEGWKRAIELFEMALAKEPAYAPAYAGMSSALGCLSFFGFRPAEKSIPQSRAAAMGALSIDDNLAEAHLSLALITFFFDWAWSRSEQEFELAIALDPHNAEALSFYGIFLGREERFDEAIEYGERSLEIDPLSPLINMNVGWTYFSAGVFDKAFERIENMIEIEPEFYGAHWLAGAIHLTEGKYDDAAASLEKAVANGGRQIVLSDLGSAYGLAGRKDNATEVLDQLLENREREYAPAFCIARVYCRLGENEKAIEWFETAREERNGEMVFLKGEIEGAADDDPLRRLGEDPRLVAILDRVQSSGRS